MTRVFAGGASPANSRPDLRHAWQECARSGALADNVEAFVNDVANMSLTLTNAVCVSGVGFFSGRVSRITLPCHEDYNILSIVAKATWIGLRGATDGKCLVAALLTFLRSAIRTTARLQSCNTLIASAPGSSRDGLGAAIRVSEELSGNRRPGQ